MSTATAMLAKYLAAEQAILDGKEISFNDRKLRMEDLAEIRKGRIEWEQRVSAEGSATSKQPRIGGLGFSVARMDQ